MMLYDRTMTCQAIKRSEEDCCWWELSFEDETGERCIPALKEVVTRTTKSRFKRSSKAASSVDIVWEDSCRFGTDDVSERGMDESTCGSVVSARSSGTKTSRTKSRRPSIGQLARSISMRFDNDHNKDNQTKSTKSTSTSSSGGDDSATRLSPPSDIRTSPPNRQALMRLQRTSFSQKYVGFKDRAKRIQQSDERRGLIKSSLYMCIEDDEDEYTGKFLQHNNVRCNAPANRAA